MELNTIYKELGISKEVYELGETIEKELKDRFREIDEVAEYNQMKVILAMQKNNLSEALFGATTG